MTLPTQRNTFVALIVGAVALLTTSCLEKNHGESVHPSKPGDQVSTIRAEEFGFPNTLDLSKNYLFYLHGRIVEDQEFPVVSEEFGEYEYWEILERFRSIGFVVISEKRAANTRIDEYAETVRSQVEKLVAGGIAPESIAIVGASKGSYIAATASMLLRMPELRFIFLGSCHPSVLEQWKARDFHVYGHILAIRDYMDTDLAGSCDELASLSRGSELSAYKEIVLRVGTGHGILYKPLDDWLNPTVTWARPLLAEPSH